ncbi:hypothetical protein ACXDS7_005272 [Klebsiella pneumoniae]
MNKKLLWIYILFVLSFSARIQVSEAKDVWVFDKVSSSTVLGMTDADRVRNLTTQFRQVEIVTEQTFSPFIIPYWKKGKSALSTSSE